MDKKSGKNRNESGEREKNAAKGATKCTKSSQLLLTASSYSLPTLSHKVQLGTLAG